MNWLPRKNVVVPTDLSEFSLSVLDIALQLVEDASQVHLVYVLRDMSAMEPGIVWGEVDDESRRRHAEEAIRKRLTDPKYAKLNLVILFGTPSMQIARHAQKIGADLIVIHSHGRTGPAHLLIGSVTERVVRLAPCPVLVIRD